MLALLRVLLRVRGGAQGNQHEQRPHQRVGKSIEVLGSEHAETDVRARVTEGGVSPQHFPRDSTSTVVVDNGLHLLRLGVRRPLVLGSAPGPLAQAPRAEHGRRSPRGRHDS